MLPFGYLVDGLVEVEVKKKKKTDVIVIGCPGIGTWTLKYLSAPIAWYNTCRPIKLSLCHRSIMSLGLLVARKLKRFEFFCNFSVTLLVLV